MSEQLPSNPKLCPVCDWQLPPEYHSYSLRDHLATHNGLEVFLALRAEERTTDEPKADLELPEHLRDAVAVVARGKQILKEINPCRERLPSHPNYDCLHANGHEGQCDFKKRPTPGAENDPLVVWVLERLENCQEIAAKKTGDDRAGWIDDAEQFAAILRRLCSVSPPFAVGSRVNWRGREGAITEVYPRETLYRVVMDDGGTSGTILPASELSHAETKGEAL